MSLPGVPVNLAAAGQSISLDQLFRSPLDGSQELSFQITSKNDPRALLAQARITNGQLTLVPRPGAIGNVTVTVKAAFTKNFHLYDNISGTIGVDKPDTLSAGMTRSQILYHWHMFNKDPLTDEYDTSRLNEERLAHFIKTEINSTDNLVLDIEDDTLYGNDLRGRANLAAVTSLVRRIRPDVKNLGFYGIVPKQSWWQPVRYRRGKRDQERKITSTYTYNFDEFARDYTAWKATNSQLRNPEFTSENGEPESFIDKVSASYPVLYTRYRDFDVLGAHIPVAVNPDESSAHKTLTVFSTGNCGFEVGSEVQFVPSGGARLPEPLLPAPQSYYVVSSEGNGLRFKISTTPAGAAITASKPFSTTTYIHRINQGRSLCQDQDVVDWPFYAEEGIQEARRIAPGKPAIAFLSPSMGGAGEIEIEGEFWLQQLMKIHELADGAIIWDYYLEPRSQRASSDWWKATEAFLRALRPRTITFTVSMLPQADLGDSSGLHPPRNLVVLRN